LDRLIRTGAAHPGVGWSGRSAAGAAAPRAAARGAARGAAPAPAPMAVDEEEGSIVDAVMAEAAGAMPAPVDADNNH
jgi:hypothetical protein